MQQAVLITAYKNIRHLVEIIDFLNNSNFIYFIHIDKKSIINDKDILFLSQKENVRVIDRHYKINWGGINHLKAILRILKEAFRDNDIEYFHLITGHDFPIKSAGYITSFLENNKGKEFMEVNKLPYAKWPGNGGIERLTLYNLYDEVDGRNGLGRRIINNLNKVQKRLGIKRGFNEGFPPLYGGSTYWTLSRNAIGYVFDYMDNNPQYLKRFKYSFCSEEMFFQTLLCNSHFKENIVNNNLRYIIWEQRNGNFPANLDNSDFESIINSDALFGRKFEYPVSEGLLLKLKSYLQDKQ